MKTFSVCNALSFAHSVTLTNPVSTVE
jgi:hypothetical protein